MSTFHCVCVSGVQVGEPVDTVEQAETAMSNLALDGVPGRSLTVETYRQDGPNRPAVETAPWYAHGRWHESRPARLAA